MDQMYDPRNVFSAMHHKVTGDLLQLMDGFYSNIEDGLFELAYRHADPEQQSRCFNLMREMRFQRGKLIQAFAKRMQKNLENWFGDRFQLDLDHDLEYDTLARKMSSKCSSHFTYLLDAIAERTAFAMGKNFEQANLPINPYHVSYAFVVSCKSLEFDKHSIEIVQELFGRFVLDRLGAVYGECNQRLEDAGFYTQREQELVSSA